MIPSVDPKTVASNLLDADQAITRGLARHVASIQYASLPAAVVSAARRGLIDWIGCALAGSSHPTLDKVVAVALNLNPVSKATLIGRKCRAGVMEAALVNGQMGHVLDYDDTHMAGVVLHASSPVLGALFALSEDQPHAACWGDFISAYVAGFEAGVRIGQASPGHHGSGWHLTGTLGTFAASAAAARMLGLTDHQVVHALGIAGSQAAGMQQNRGTMVKSFHAGKAAANGVLAAKLAQQNFDSAEDIIEGKRGFCRIFSNVAAPEILLADIGHRWEIARNGHKPYACGVVLHPSIEALIKIRTAHLPDPTAIENATLRVHPLVLAITGLTDPQTGLKSKFSNYHSAAVALVDGAAGIAQYSDRRAVASDVIALRRKVKVVADESLRRDEAFATVVVNNHSYEAHIDHATGTADNPMSDDAIKIKFFANAQSVMDSSRARRIYDWVEAADEESDVRELVSFCA